VDPFSKQHPSEYPRMNPVLGGRAVGQIRYPQPVLPVRQGAHITAFHLESTVVLVFEPGRVELAPELQPHAPVRLGMVIGRAAPG
jgi:phosphatidylserine decarboxylase